MRSKCSQSYSSVLIKGELSNKPGYLVYGRDTAREGSSCVFATYGKIASRLGLPESTALHRRYRRSELVGLDVQEIQFTREGLVATTAAIRRTKKGKASGRYSIRLTPRYLPSPGVWHGLRRRGSWKAPSSRQSTVISRSGFQTRQLCWWYRGAAQATGLDPPHYAGHSLQAGSPPWRPQPRHKSVTVARKYIRLGSLWQENVAAQRGGEARCEAGSTSVGASGPTALLL